MNFITSFFRSSIGKKWIVALTGLVLIGYVIGHLVGNLQVFAGPDKINKYAEFLHGMGGALWVVRLFLLACFAAHIVTTILLVVQNRAARDVPYAKQARVRSTLASRSMALSGLVVLAFVIYHLLHLTVRATDSRFRPVAEGGLLTSEYDVYSMIILSFQHPLVAGFYLLAVFLLCLHLSHGFSSLLQTLGINSKKTMPLISHGGRILAWVIFAGYASIPLAVWFGALKLHKAV